MMVSATPQAWLIDGVRTPIGNIGGALSAIRADDLAARVGAHRCSGRTSALHPHRHDRDRHPRTRVNSD
jgi:hypothetical protein